MFSRRTKPPSYRHHKASGQAVVTLGGRDIYLGPHGTKVSKAEYDRVVGEWLANGRTLPASLSHHPAAALYVVQIVNAFRKADVYPKSQRAAYIAVMSLLTRLYGRKLVTDFGPIALKVVRDAMVKAGWKRRTVNQRVHNLRRIFKWGVEHEMFSAEQLVALRAVEPLREGTTDAPESEEIEPVAVEHVEACVAHMMPTLTAMVRLQMLTGMRAGELCSMRTGDIETSGQVWVYLLGSHKNKHRGKLREIAIGPRAIEHLRAFLKTDLAAFVFSPAQAEVERRASRTAKRKTAAGQGNAVGTNRVRDPIKTAGDRYDTDSYRRAIEYATHRAFPLPAELERLSRETKAAWRARLGADGLARLKAHRKAHHWSTHQLRHAFGTKVINLFTAEHAQRSLGHSTMKATAIYAKLNLEKAKEVAREIG